MTQKHKTAQLPLFEDKTILPNGKFHVSFSEMTDWDECSYRHLLKHVKKIDIDGPSIHTSFGTAIHDSLEEFLLTGKKPDQEEAKRTFHRELAGLTDEERVKLKSEIVEFETQLPDMIAQVPGWLDQTFPGWKPFSAEHFLFESIEGQINIHFKGFIDAIIMVPKKQTKKEIKEGTPPSYFYYLLDWKTCSWGWPADRKRDPKKHAQLVLYKHYFSKVLNLDLKQIKCGFVLIKRVVGKTRKPFDRLEFVSISAGEKTIEKSLKTVNAMINQMRQGRAIKNRMKCRPFCPYYMTKHCT